MIIHALMTVALLGAADGESAPTDDELTAAGNGAHTVDASRGVVFGMQWRRPIVRTGIYRTVASSFGGPAISLRHQLLFVGSGEGEVRAYGLHDGQVAWRYDHGKPFEGTAAVVRLGGADGEELVVVGSRDGTVVALTATAGVLRWQTVIDGEPRAAPQTLGDNVLLTTGNNKVALLDAKTGTLVWTRGRPAPTELSVNGHARAVAADGVVYTTFSDGYVEAFSLEDGSSLWSRPLSLKGGDFVDADADPVLADGRLYVASYSDGVYALDPKDGQTVWMRAAPAVTSLAEYDDLLLVASADGYVWGLVRNDGEMLYRTRIPPGPTSRLVVDRDVAVLTAGDAGLIVINARNGRPLQASTFADPFNSDPTWEQDELAVVSGSGYVYKLRFGTRGLVQ